MTSTNLAYWVMGFFEINDDKEVTLNEKQTQIIKNHLNLVFKYDKNPSSFCHWLRGFFDSGDYKALDETKVKLIKFELNKIFKHEIDLSYTNDVTLINEMNHIHNGGNNLPDGSILRC